MKSLTDKDLYEIRKLACLSFADTYGGIYLDCNNILYKKVNDEWIGKRSVYTHTLRAVWIDEATEEETRDY